MSVRGARGTPGASSPAGTRRRARGGSRPSGSALWSCAWCVERSGWRAPRPAARCRSTRTRGGGHGPRALCWGAPPPGGLEVPGQSSVQVGGVEDADGSGQQSCSSSRIPWGQVEGLAGSCAEPADMAGDRRESAGIDQVPAEGQGSVEERGHHPDVAEEAGRRARPDGGGRAGRAVGAVRRARRLPAGGRRCRRAGPGMRRMRVPFVRAKWAPPKNPDRGLGSGTYAGTPFRPPREQRAAVRLPDHQLRPRPP